MRVLSANEVVKIVLKKGNSNILHLYLGLMGEINNKRIVSVINTINGDQINIYICELYISIKIMQNSSNKSISKVDRVYIDL